VAAKRPSPAPAGKKAPRKPVQVAAQRSAKAAGSRANAGKRAAPPHVAQTPAAPAAPRLRLRLTNIDEVKRELARLYRETRAKRVDTQEASRMANMLSILGRLIEGSDLEARLSAMEREQQKDGES
jgi:hypothetical protein